MIEKRMDNQGKADKVEVEMTIISRSFSMVSKLDGIWQKQIEQQVILALYQTLLGQPFIRA
jgi:hypothetical protein